MKQRGSYQPAMLVSSHNYETKWFFAISGYEHEHALPSILQAKTASYCKRDLPLIESPDLEIHTTEQHKSEFVTAFVKICVFPPFKEILVIVTSIRISNLVFPEFLR